MRIWFIVMKWPEVDLCFYQLMGTATLSLWFCSKAHLMKKENKEKKKHEAFNGLPTM